jgi:glycosyltransferase involved in cell wall biosynthesis
MASAGSRRRVLIIVENLPVPFDRRVWLEARTLRDAGYTVSVICPKAPGYESSYELVDGVHIHRHPLPTEADRPTGYALEYAAALFWELALATRIAFGRGFDVIHACNPPDDIVLVAAPFKLFGRKFIFDHHDLNPELFEAKFGKRGALYRVVRWLERLTFRLADVSIATNESYQRIAIERGGMDPDRVFVVRSAPDLEVLRPVPADESLKNGRRYLVGYVGVMGKQEGIDHLLRAVKHIVDDMGRRDIHFGIAGGGTELESMKTYAGALGVAEYVTFTGRIPDEDLVGLLSTADVCVNPDTVNELNDKSTMNKIMEYMALGKPIVQFETTEGRFTAQEASVYAAPNDAIDFAVKLVELIDDPVRRATMGALGRRRVSDELGWDRSAVSLLEAYSDLDR